MRNIGRAHAHVGVLGAMAQGVINFWAAVFILSHAAFSGVGRGLFEHYRIVCSGVLVGRKKQPALQNEEVQAVFVWAGHGGMFICLQCGITEKCRLLLEQIYRDIELPAQISTKGKNFLKRSNI